MAMESDPSLSVMTMGCLVMPPTPMMATLGWLMMADQRRRRTGRVGDGKRSAFDVGGHQLLGTGALAEVGDAALQSQEVEFVGVFENGDDESPIEGDGDTGVNVFVITDAVAFERTVDDGILLQGD